MKSKPKRKRVFKYEHALFTLRNVADAAKQAALLHPYPRERAKAAEIAPVMHDIVLAVTGDSLTKNEMLIRIARHPVMTQGQSDAIPILRTAILTNLDTRSAMQSFAVARELISLGRAAEPDRAPERWDWMEKAVSELEENGFEGVQFQALATLSDLHQRLA